MFIAVQAATKFSTDSTAKEVMSAMQELTLAREAIEATGRPMDFMLTLRQAVAAAKEAEEYLASRDLEATATKMKAAAAILASSRLIKEAESYARTAEPQEQ